MLLCAKGKILLKNDKTDFTQGRILPKLAFFMLPILGALVLQAAYGAVDLLVVGRFGSTSGLSAVSTGSQVLNLVTFVVTQLAMGMVGYFNGNDKTLWVMVQGLVQTLLVRLPMAYIMSIQPNASLTMIGLSAPTSTAVGILLNIGFFLWLKRYENQTSA
jgi:Na+-driven multidrug efflux pump